MFDHWGAFVSRHWAIVIALWVALAAGMHLVAPRWNDVTHDGDLAYLPETMPSVVGERLLNRAFPESQAKSEMAVVVEPLADAVARIAAKHGPPTSVRRLA